MKTPRQDGHQGGTVNYDDNGDNDEDDDDDDDNNNDDDNYYDVYSENFFL